jgi:hypothetical protein
MDAEEFEKLEATPIGWCSLEDVFNYLHHRRYGEPVILLRLNEEEAIISPECTAEQLRKVGRSMIRHAKIMEDDDTADSQG